MAKAWIVALLALPVAAQTGVEELLEKRLAAEIAAYAEKVDGALGVAAIDLATGRVFAHNADAVFAQASVIKIPILVRAYEAAREGKLRLEQTVRLEPGEAVGGSGVLRERLESGAVTVTVRELLGEMIRSSDNTATNRIIAMVGMESVNAMLDRMGLGRTRLRRVMMDTAAARRGSENVSTPLEMARLVELIARGKAGAPEDCKEMLALMGEVEGGFKQGIPNGVAIASKTGAVPGVHAEAGVVRLERRPFVLAVMAAGLGEGPNPVPGAAWLVYRHFARLDGSNAYGHKVH